MGGRRGRPDRAETRCKLPSEARVRSNDRPLSALVNSHTIHESLSTANRALDEPASSDHLKIKLLPTSSGSARDGRNRGASRCTPNTACEFSPPVVARQLLTGSKSMARTAMTVRRSQMSARYPVEQMPTIFEQEAARQPSPCGDVSTATLKEPSTDSISSNNPGAGGDFSGTPDTPDHIDALDDTTVAPDNDTHPSACTSDPPCLARGERADFLLEFTRAVGENVTLDRRRHTTRASIFGGFKTTRTHVCTVLLDTGSPATFI